MIRNRQVRRPAAIALLVAGALMMWLAPATAVGVALLALGIALEAIGIAMEHRDKS